MESRNSRQPFSPACASCSPSYVQGGGFRGLVHERGCPDAWRTAKRECVSCGIEFVPEERGQRFCDPECAQTYSS